MKVVFCLIFSFCSLLLWADSLDAPLKGIMGIDVKTKQNDRSRVVVFAKPYGFFTNATVFATADGHICQIRCVYPFSIDVDAEKMIEDAKTAISTLYKTFPVSSDMEVQDKKCLWRRFVKFKESRARASVSVADAKNHNKPLGYKILNLTFFLPPNIPKN